MLNKLLRRHHRHKRLNNHWQLLNKLVAGGSAVDDEVKKQLLTTPNCRSQDVVEERIKTAPYFSLMGAILARLQSHLLADKATYKSLPDTKDDFWQSEFFPHGVISDRGRVSFHQGLKDATLLALAQGSAIAQIDVPHVTAENRAQQEMLGGDRPYVIIRSRCDLWDWENDKEGLIFAKLHTFRYRRQGWLDDVIPEHEFTVYQRESWGGVTMARYLVRPKDISSYQERPFILENINPDDIAIVEDLAPTEVFHLEGRNPFPVTILEFDPTLCIADQLFDSQKSHFNQTAAAEWALLSTNYAQLIFNDVDDEDELKLRIGKAGDGYYWALQPGVKATWLERSGQGIDRALSYRDTKKAEMLEIISQIAVTAASAYAQLNRSGESKKEDRRNMDILLEVYGQAIAEFAKQNLEVASIAHGTALTWAVDGFHKYDSDSLLEDLNEYQECDRVLNSPTFRKASQEKLATQAIEALGLPLELTDTIVSEIAENTFVLDDKQLDFLQSLASVGRLSNEGLFSILKAVKLLPDDFNIEAELQRLGTIPVNLATADDEELLS